MNQFKIYIIDDNEIICDALLFLFQSTYHNFDLKVYQDPHLFLQEYSPQEEGCLLVDMNMPSMNGIELAKQLKEASTRLKIFVMSGFLPEPTIQSSLKYVDEFLKKPLNIDYLLKQINCLLELSSFHQKKCKK